MKNASDEKAKQQETWHRLVVKVISWSDGLSFGGVIKKKDKILPKEWQTYCNHFLKINLNNNKEKVWLELKATEEKIKKFGGFEGK